MNNCSFTGRIVKEVILNSKGQTIWVNNTIAIPNRKKVENNWVDDAVFIDFSVFGKNAEIINKYTKKGDRISLIGKLVQENWVDKNNNNRTLLKLLVEKIHLIDYTKPDINENNTKDNEDDEIPF